MSTPVKAGAEPRLPQAERGAQVPSALLGWSQTVWELAPPGSSQCPCPRGVHGGFLGEGGTGRRHPPPPYGVSVEASLGGGNPDSGVRSVCLLKCLQTPSTGQELPHPPAAARPIPALPLPMLSINQSLLKLKCV